MREGGDNPLKWAKLINNQQDMFHMERWGFNMGGVVAVAGSRSLPSGEAGLVRRVCGSLVRGGHSLAVGCCVGTDEAVLSSMLVAGAASRLSVFAAFGPGGAGAAGSASAVSVVAAVASAGASVRWWAGGPAGVPVQVRLANRTQVVVGAACVGLVVFFGSPVSLGSLLACRLAVARGLPVWAFPVGFPGRLLPSPCVGAWVASGRGGVWPGAWRWVPAQGALFQ